MTTEKRINIYADAGRRGADNLRRVELGRTTEAHLHDFGITISAGDLTPEQMVTLRHLLYDQTQALVERMNAALGATKVGWFISYDGSRECGEHLADWQ